MMSKGEEAVLGVSPKEVTIFFSDIAGFTTICEAMKPNELLILLSDYFAAMSAIITKSRGTLLEFIGDALLVVWNAPQDVADHAYQTVEAAIQMNEYLNLMAPKWTELGYPPINIRSGIHTATVFVGNIGSPDRMKYGVLGDGVNLASRLEELNKRYKTKIMISINTEKKKKVQNFFLTRPLDLVAVKGKKTGTAVFEVLGRRTEVTDAINKLADTSKQGFDYYYGRSFQEAVDTFTDAGKQYQALNGIRDAASDLLMNRCKDMLVNPPPDGWNGTEVLNQKHF
jgi:adenylate cyclase